jgi:hypothetical protein
MAVSSDGSQPQARLKRLLYREAKWKCESVRDQEAIKAA